MDNSKPHIYKPEGNGLFCHIPSNFTDEEAESWVNKERPLGDVLWKRAPVAIDGTPSRVDCPDGHGNHILFTIDGKPYTGNDDHTPPSMGGHAAHPGVPQGLIDALRAAGADVHVVGGGVAASGSGLDGLLKAIKAATNPRASLDDKFEALHAMTETLPRPKTPHIKVDGYGAGSLLNFKPELGKKNREFMQELMRGPSALTILEREIIATHVSLSNNAMYCTLAHKATAVALAGGNEEFVLASRTPKMKAIGAFAIAVNERVNLPPEFIQRIRDAGWNDEALHDCAMVVAAFAMMNTYVEGLAAITPTDEASYKAVGERLAQRGYTATA